MSVGCGDAHRDPLGHWSCLCKGASVPAVTLWGGVSVAASLENGQTGKFP